MSTGLGNNRPTRSAGSSSMLTTLRKNQVIAQNKLTSKGNKNTSSSFTYTSALGSVLSQTTNQTFAFLNDVGATIPVPVPVPITPGSPAPSNFIILSLGVVNTYQYAVLDDTTNKWSAAIDSEIQLGSTLSEGPSTLLNGNVVVSGIYPPDKISFFFISPNGILYNKIILTMPPPGPESYRALSIGNAALFYDYTDSTLTTLNIYTFNPNISESVTPFTYTLPTDTTVHDVFVNDGGAIIVLVNSAVNPYLYSFYKIAKGGTSLQFITNSYGNITSSLSYTYSTPVWFVTYNSSGKLTGLRVLNTDGSVLSYTGFPSNSQLYAHDQFGITGTKFFMATSANHPQLEYFVFSIQNNQLVTVHIPYSDYSAYAAGPVVLAYYSDLSRSNPTARSNHFAIAFAKEDSTNTEVKAYYVLDGQETATSVVLYQAQALVQVNLTGVLVCGYTTNNPVTNIYLQFRTYTPYGVQYSDVYQGVLINDIQEIFGNVLTNYNLIRCSLTSLSGLYAYTMVDTYDSQARGPLANGYSYAISNNTCVMLIGTASPYDVYISYNGKIKPSVHLGIADSFLDTGYTSSAETIYVKLTASNQLLIVTEETATLATMETLTEDAQIVAYGLGYYARVWYNSATTLWTYEIACPDGVVRKRVFSTGWGAGLGLRGFTNTSNTFVFLAVDQGGTTSAVWFNKNTNQFYSAGFQTKLLPNIYSSYSHLMYD